jgi:hypothetical protein
MAQAKTQHSAAAKGAAAKGAAAKPGATARTRRPAAKAGATARTRRPAESKAAVDRTAELSEEVLESLEAGQRAAIAAVRRFVDTVDRSLPDGGAAPSKRQEVIDSAMEMADRLVHTQYDFIRKVVDSAGKSLKRGDGAK